MDEFRSIIRYQTEEYGKVRVKLAELLDAKGITRNRLRTLTGVKYEVIDRYYKAVNVEMADLDFLAKVCFVLDCKIEDLLEYEKPE
ncbi:MAG: helix-turn-helix transcriptional regulator [Clostridiales bacterium]|nr:helix-turn-helix transcriptional regulator [Clostridiales bacterium]MDD6935767.1 helix-turn-helix transcriptional regulator [Clostridiales bacterium]MDY2961605.1 helix-turn-helix transcriptional regulator [Oscillospiraceae bacterium]